MVVDVYDIGTLDAGAVPAASTTDTLDKTAESFLTARAN